MIATTFGSLAAYLFVGVSVLGLARGRLVERAGHPLIWTHTREFAEIVSAGLVGQPQFRV